MTKKDERSANSLSLCNHLAFSLSVVAEKNRNRQGAGSNAHIGENGRSDSRPRIHHPMNTSRRYQEVYLLTGLMLIGFQSCFLQVWKFGSHWCTHLWHLSPIRLFARSSIFWEWIGNEHMLPITQPILQSLLYIRRSGF